MVIRLEAIPHAGCARAGGRQQRDGAAGAARARQRTAPFLQVATRADRPSPHSSFAAAARRRLLKFTDTILRTTTIRLHRIDSKIFTSALPILSFALQIFEINTRQVGSKHRTR